MMPDPSLTPDQLAGMLLPPQRTHIHAYRGGAPEKPADHAGGAAQMTRICVPHSAIPDGRSLRQIGGWARTYLMPTTLSTILQS